MQRVSTFTVFFKESPTCHMQTSLTPPVEQEVKVRPGSIMTKLTEAPFQNHSFLPPKAAGSEGCTYAEVSPKPPHLQASHACPGAGGPPPWAQRQPHALH